LQCKAASLSILALSTPLNLQVAEQVADITIKYQEFSPEQKVKILISFIEQLDNKHQVADYEDFKKWVKSSGKEYAFNGRQIRNAVSTALGLALMEKIGMRLSRDHLDLVARQTEKFKIDLAAQEAVSKSNHG
jgi:hypothetical protein